MAKKNVKFSRTWREILKLPWRNDTCRIFYTPNFWENNIVAGYLEHYTFDNWLSRELIPTALANEEKACKLYQLADDSAYRVPPAEIMRWLGKSPNGCIPLQSVPQSIKISYNDEYFMRFVATQDEIDANCSKLSSDPTILEKDWLQSRGIRKNSPDEKMFLERYMPE